MDHSLQMQEIQKKYFYLYLLKMSDPIMKKIINADYLLVQGWNT